MKHTCSAGVHLPPGTYWVDWQAAGSLASGPWVPPVTILGQTTTGDAKQQVTGTWGPVLDGTYPQGLPFVVRGTVTP